MPRILKLRKSLLVATTLLAGGTMFGNGCLNTALSIPVCGTVLTFCTPTDQLNLVYPLLETPDYDADPSCTIPLGCGASDLFDGSIPPGFPGGDASEQPEDEQTGTGAGGGGV